MRKFANIFFVVYLADGLISLLHELLLSPPVSGLRNLVAFGALLIGLPLYLCLGIDRRLPKGIIIPQVLFIFWAALGAWPVGAGGSVGLTAAVIQTLLGLLPLIVYAGTAGGNRLLPAERFRADFFSLPNTLVFFIVHLLLMPLFAGFVALSLLGHLASDATAGFMRFDTDGLYLQERVYSRSGKEIRLAGMIHIGEADFYKDLLASVPSGRTVILAEGVSDREGLLTSRFDYGGMAQLLGLEAQAEVEVAGRWLEADELDRLEADDFSPDEPHLIRADTDLSSFSPQTIEFINRLGQALFSGKPLPEGMREYDAWAKENMTPEQVEAIMADVLAARNAELIGWLDKALPVYDTIVIPWGALHMPAFEQAVLERGFRQTGERERLSVDFATLPIDQILQKLAEKPARPELLPNTL